MTRSWALGCLLVAACANNVPQDRSTGPDGRIKGALPVVLNEGEGNAKGVVTYPGGDRVDWKVIELPEGKKGRLDLSMNYKTPRPGLRVAFDVFDQWNIPVIEAAKSKGKLRSATIDKATGKYFVRIYAPRRGDAGQYTLKAEFHENIVAPPPDITVPEPPHLPRIPDACEFFDRTDPSCADQCPQGAPKDWKGCVKDAGGTPPPPPPPPPPQPPTPPVVAAKPFVGRVLKVDIAGDGLDVVIGGGSEQGIAKGWNVRVLRGDTTSPLSGGSGTVVRVNKTTTIVHVKLTTNQMGANPNVELSPAP